jgi:hypothetical protein
MTAFQGFLLGLTSGVAPESHLSGLHCTGSGSRRPQRSAPSASRSASAERVINWLVRLVRTVGLSNRPDQRSDPYRAFVIGPDGLAVAVHAVAAHDDGEALKRTALLKDGVRIELWRGTRKVGDIPAKSEKKSDGEVGPNSV